MATVKLLNLKAAIHRLGGISPPSTCSLFYRASPALRAFSSATSPPSKAVVYEQHGPPDAVCKVVELPPVPIKDDDVCVRMLAAPINPSDINRIEGRFIRRSGLEKTSQIFCFFLKILLDSWCITRPDIVVIVFHFLCLIVLSKCYSIEFELQVNLLRSKQ